MIILFTSNVDGGVLQFVVQALKETVLLKKQVRCYIPQGAKVTITPSLAQYVVWYVKVKSIYLYNKSVRKLASSMISELPELVWYFDNGVVCSQLINLLGAKVKQVMIMHDAGTSHLSNNVSLKSKIRRWYKNMLSRNSEGIVSNIITLSPESEKTYKHLRPNNANKVYTLLLGAHLPDCTEMMPLELSDIERYNLFFGRIDKYKGIEQMLASYALTNILTPLVIAGNGRFTEKEQELISKDKRVITINRYIDDSEMLFLFHHCNVVITPYIEATQSGIIPIAYKYGKPIISSNLKGLTQFVVDKETGVICNSLDDFANAYKLFEDEKSHNAYSKHASFYYGKHLDWSNNISNMYKEL